MSSSACFPSFSGQKYRQRFCITEIDLLKQLTLNFCFLDVCEIFTFDPTRKSKGELVGVRIGSSPSLLLAYTDVKNHLREMTRRSRGNAFKILFPMWCSEWTSLSGNTPELSFGIRINFRGGSWSKIFISTFARACVCGYTLLCSKSKSISVTISKFAQFITN